MFKILFVLLLPIVNRHRGGGPPFIRDMVKDLTGWKFIRQLWTASLVLFGLSYLLIPDLEFSAYVTIGWTVWALVGWGSYFDSGRNSKSYRDEPEVAWIDTILYLKYGPKWIPASEKKPEKYVRDGWKWSWKKLLQIFPLSLGFMPPDCVVAPNLNVRPKEWREKRDHLGMILRGTHSIVFAILMALYFDQWWIVVTFLPFSWLFACIYKEMNKDGVRAWIKDKLPEAILPNSKYFRFDLHHHSIAEAAVGLLWAVWIVSIVCVAS